MHRRHLIAGLALAGLVARSARATVPGEGLLSHLIGEWDVTGQTRGRATATGAVVSRLFGGLFIELLIKDPTGRSPYEARVFFGMDVKGGLVVHWLDATGGESSKTLGFGRLEADAAVFSFAYPDGTFRDRLSYDAGADTWRLRIETGDEASPVVFSDWRFTRRAR